MANFRLALTIVLIFFGAGAGPRAFGVPCLTPNASLALTYPGIIEANVGITAGKTSVNPTRACQGLMLDVGSNAHASRAAIGVRAFQRYGWPVAMQADIFAYRAHSEDNAAPGLNCAGVELGYGVLMAMLRLGVGRCPAEDRVFGLIGIGVFY